jgi:hypothetical protein
VRDQLFDLAPAQRNRVDGFIPGHGHAT